jgi:D-alanyl-D-alanine carboxypeptidase/D-alanyl-D-alanine-endopeptidase (penicillin-binding protein 4)
MKNERNVVCGSKFFILHSSFFFFFVPLHAIMKKYCFFTLIFWLSVTVKAQIADSAETFLSENDSLCMKLDSLLDVPLFETSQVGLMVYDLTADSAIYCYNHRQKLRPASCMKLVTGITALDQLGPKYEYQTRLYYTGEVRSRTLWGNIYCVGGFDPMLTQDDVITLAASVRNLGIDSICGLIVADRSFKESLDYGEGWCWDDENPMLIALTIGRKDNFTSTLAEEISRLGINLENVELMQGRKPDHAQPLDVCCHSITQVLERMMKMSDNFYAESMFYQTAASTGRHPATAEDARNITRKLINRVGLNASNYRIADGSGLSLYNYVTAELLVRLLRHAWRTPLISKALMPSLPVAGVDGTLKTRMLKTAAQGNVRAKTGTLTGISSLAGYCTAPNGHELAFAIINQGILDKTSGKAFQDRVCRVLCGEKLGVEGVKEVKRTAAKKGKTTRSRQSARSARKPRGKRR